MAKTKKKKAVKKKRKKTKKSIKKRRKLKSGTTKKLSKSKKKLKKIKSKSKTIRKTNGGKMSAEMKVSSVLDETVQILQGWIEDSDRKEQV